MCLIHRLSVCGITRPFLQMWPTSRMMAVAPKGLGTRQFPPDEQLSCCTALSDQYWETPCVKGQSFGTRVPPPETYLKSGNRERGRPFILPLVATRRSSFLQALTLLCVRALCKCCLFSSLGSKGYHNVCLVNIKAFFLCERPKQIVAHFITKRHP